MGASADAAPSFRPFQIIAARNIFCPTPGRQATEASPGAKPVMDSLALTGIMSYEKGSFAFFDGSKPDFRKALKAGDSVGGWAVTRITSKQVRMKAGAQELQLEVGMRLVRVNGGEWKLDTSAQPAPSAAEVAAPKVQAPNPNQAAKAAEMEDASDPEKDIRRMEKKLEKYLGEEVSQLKKDKIRDPMFDSFDEKPFKKSDKHSKDKRG